MSEEADKYKALYEQEKARLAELLQQEKARALTATKQTLLLEAGYPAEKLADLTGFIMGDDEDALKESIERFKVVAPPTKQDDGYEAARERVRRLKRKGII